MPPRAPKACGHIGCTKLVRDGGRKCEDHRTAWANTGKTWDRSNTKARRELRAAVFKAARWQCQIRTLNVCVITATILDRVDNKRGYERDNCQAACRPCHDRKSSKEGHEARGHRV